MYIDFKLRMLCSALLKHRGEAMESKLSIEGLPARRDAKVNKLASFGPTLQGTLTNIDVGGQHEVIISVGQ